MPGILFQYIAGLLGVQILNSRPVTGGDISSAYSLSTNDGNFFVKANPSHSAPAMFEAEKKALAAISSSQTIAVPEVILTGQHQGMSFIVMNMLENRQATSVDFSLLGKQLAQLHQAKHSRFGFEEDNFIGILPQKNNWHDNWTDFYIHCRLLPQFKMALDRSLLSATELLSVREMKETLNPLFKGIKASLLHGDLWNGNYLIEKSGVPYLIDPAVYYGHSEVDIAMTQLFGGFGKSFYEDYHSIIPLDLHSQKRIEIYKLYYLLVHLNLFGISYYPQVMRIVNTVFR